MKVLYGDVQARGGIIVQAYCRQVARNSGRRVWEMFHIFLIAAQMLSGSAEIISIVSVLVLLQSQMISLEVAVPPQEATGQAAANLRLQLVLRPVLYTRIFALQVPVLLAVRLSLVLHASILEPHLHLLLR